MGLAINLQIVELKIQEEEMRFSKTPFNHERPSWWPENEPWPPIGRHGRIRRGHFFRRVGFLFIFLNFGLSAVVVLAISFAAHYYGYLQIPDTLRWLVPVVLFLIFFGLGFVTWIGRGLRRMSAPFGELVGAADRVAEKDYSVRVKEQGPAEVRSLAHAFNSMAARLQTHDKERRNLLADVSHELRTPLTIIQGNVEGMLDGVYPPDETHLKTILEQSQVLSRLVEDLRTLALAESGSLTLRLEPTDLAVLITDIAAAFRSQAEAAGISLKIETFAETPLIDLDPVRMREVLSNLVANAIRYASAQGEIRIQLSQTVEAGKKFQVISVHDNGSGISAEDLPHIFDRFYKTRDSSGIGLGLSIARNLVEAHGGTIQAESQNGNGTTICISLPADE